MVVQTIRVTVSPSGEVTARADSGAVGPTGPCRFEGVDAELIRVFERWLTDGAREWEWSEIKAFGSLLHRSLFPDSLWGWIETELAVAGRQSRLRLQLEFPDTGMAELASVPWEYLHVPDRSGRDGYFLAADRRCMLSRFMSLQTGRGVLATESRVRLLCLVSRPQDLGEVVWEPVVEMLTQLTETLPIDLHVLHQPTRGMLRDAVAEVQPHMVHYMGHGQYTPGQEQGEIALVTPQERSDWVGEAVLAQLLDQGGDPPRLVLFHSCAGAQTNYRASFAGLAPRLLRRGVQCVVAMQYAVTNGMAIDFSKAFYRGLADGLPVDESVQRGRNELHTVRGDDSRLLGIPVIYLNSRDAVLVPRHDDTPA